MDINYYLNDIKSNVDSIIPELEKLNKELFESKSPLGKIQVLKQYKLYTVSVGREPINRVKDWYDEDCKTWEENEEIVKQNLAIVNRIIAMTVASGIKDSEYKYKNSRRVSGNWVTATWKNSLLSQLPKNVNKYDLDKIWKNAKEKHDKEEQSKKDEIERNIREQKERQDSINKMKIIVSLAAKYEIEPPDNVTEFVEILRVKDKYLDLAIAMEDTRGDWNEGFWRVEDALNRFKPETPEDFLIFRNVMGCCDGHESDGRIFRDTEYSYDVLFKMVNPEIYNDYIKLSDYRYQERY
jgi:hypothetical protein